MGSISPNLVVILDDFLWGNGRTPSGLSVPAWLGIIRLVTVHPSHDDGIVQMPPGHFIQAANDRHTGFPQLIQLFLRRTPP